MEGKKLDFSFVSETNLNSAGCKVETCLPPSEEIDCLDRRSSRLQAIH